MGSFDDGMLHMPAQDDRYTSREGRMINKMSK